MNQLLNRHKVPTSHYSCTTRNTATQWSRRSVDFAKGSVESTHKVPTSHYQTKHRTDPGAVTGQTRVDFEKGSVANFVGIAGLCERLL